MTTCWRPWPGWLIVADPRSRRRLLLGLAGLAGATGLGAVLLAGPSGPWPRDRLVVADPRQVSSALFYIALHRGYFAEQNLDIDLQPYSYSRRAVEAVMQGRAELAMSSEVPIMHALADGARLNIIANIQTTDRDLAILARADSGVTTATDLSGKRVGYIPRTNGKLFLDLFVASHDLTGVTMVAFPPEDLVAALVEGRVDAVSSWTAIRFSAAGHLSDTVVLSAPSAYIELWGVVVPEAVAQGRQRALKKLLRGLVRAEQMAMRDPEAAITLVAEHLGQERGDVAALWPHFTFAVDLSQTFLVNLENAARSEQRAGVDPSHFDFSQAIHAAALQEVDPRRVLLLR